MECPHEVARIARSACIKISQLVNSCWQVWNKLLSSCNKVDEGSKLATSCSNKSGISLVATTCSKSVTIINLATRWYQLVPDLSQQLGTSSANTSWYWNDTNLVTTCLQIWKYLPTATDCHGLWRQIMPTEFNLSTDSLRAKTCIAMFLNSYYYRANLTCL